MAKIYLRGNYGGGRYIIHPPKEYQGRLKTLHGRRVKVIVVEEGSKRY